ncbi:hypothetical protein [Pseudomonas phage Astolliot]|nr:hypothetical protein [Pseudomonas phage Astolliot]
MRMMDEPSILAGKPIKITPHIPFYKQSGCSVVREWESEFVDRVGNSAILTHVEYTDKKGKSHEAVIRVKWI